jgi:hypothetical protein
MLITPSDFEGEYRLFNANNLDPDTVKAIDQAQDELARDLFPIGHSFIINNGPMDPPNFGLRMLGLHKLFVPWVFLRLELGILGAGVKRTSDVPGRSKFASGAFFAIARHYRSFVRFDWPEFEDYIRATASSPTVLSVPVIVSQVIAPGMEIEVEGGDKHSVVASATGLLTISPALPLGVTNLRFRQLSLRIDRNWNYL